MSFLQNTETIMTFYMFLTKFKIRAWGANFEFWGPAPARTGIRSKTCHETNCLHFWAKTCHETNSLHFCSTFLKQCRNKISPLEKWSAFQGASFMFLHIFKQFYFLKMFQNVLKTCLNQFQKYICYYLFVQRSFFVLMVINGSLFNSYFFISRFRSTFSWPCG